MRQFSRSGRRSPKDADTGLARWNSHVLVDAAPMMPMMLAQEASIIDIIGIPFLLPKPSGAVLVFEAVLAGAPRRVCVQNGACKGAHDALTEGGLERSKALCWGFPTKTRVFGTLALCAAPGRPGEKRRSHEARSAALCARPLLLRSRPFMARALAGHQKGRAALPDSMATASAADPR